MFLVYEYLRTLLHIYLVIRHYVFLNDVKVGSILPQKKQEIKGMPLDIYSWI